MIHTVLNDYNKKYNGSRKRTNTLGCLKEMNKISIDNTNIALDDSIRLLVAYTKRFDVILNIKFGEKIGRDDDNIYYVFNNGYFQQMTRWWYSENRFKTCDYIQQDLDEFTRYLEGYYNNILMSDGFKYDKINDGATFKKVATFNEELNNFIKQLVYDVFSFSCFNWNCLSNIFRCYFIAKNINWTTFLSQTDNPIFDSIFACNGYMVKTKLD